MSFEILFPFGLWVNCGVMLPHMPEWLVVAPSSRLLANFLLLRPRFAICFATAMPRETRVERTAPRVVGPRTGECASFVGLSRGDDPRAWFSQDLHAETVCDGKEKSNARWLVVSCAVSRLVH